MAESKAATMRGVGRRSGVLSDEELAAMQETVGGRRRAANNGSVSRRRPSRTGGHLRRPGPA